MNLPLTTAEELYVMKMGWVYRLQDGRLGACTEDGFLLFYDGNTYEKSHPGSMGCREPTSITLEELARDHWKVSLAEIMSRLEPSPASDLPSGEFVALPSDFGAVEE